MERGKDQLAEQLVSVPITVPVVQAHGRASNNSTESMRQFWSEWQDLNLRPPRPERGVSLPSPHAAYSHQA
jgi:hypothetical protein